MGVNQDYSNRKLVLLIKTAENKLDKFRFPGTSLTDNQRVFSPINTSNREVKRAEMVRKKVHFSNCLLGRWGEKGFNLAWVGKFGKSFNMKGVVLSKVQGKKAVGRTEAKMEIALLLLIEAAESDQS